jgi:hypothetical protein
MRTIIRSRIDYQKALASLDAFVVKHDYPVEIVANVASSKTMAQLGGLFAAWIPEISQFEGEGEPKVHADLKAKFLARIYIANPIGDEQNQWVELTAIYQQRGEQAKLEKHAKRISLSWARVGQMRQYMDAIHNHYASVGLVLQELEKG